ncbi:MAG: heme-binding domain-containing protein [Bacteroidetes bacterium]|nr:heme-binding domain-containing protein [Bacteroidota bacterium]
MKKKFLYIVFVVFILIQLIPSGLPKVSFDNPNDLIINNKDIPEDVVIILKNSCYDCHSNESRYPWYANISPSSLLVAHDINEGRAKFNFSNWENLSKIEKVGALDDISDVITLDEMPLAIYTLIHRNAALNNDEKEVIISWANEFSERLFE